MLVVAGFIIVVGGVISIGYECGREHYINQEQPVYEYDWNSTVGYKVYLKPNMLYEEKYLQEDQRYLSQFIDYIEVEFNNIFQGSGDTEIEGQYLSAIEVRGYSIKNEGKQIIWNKEYKLELDQTITGSKSQYRLAKTYQIDYETYNEFAKAVIDASKVSSEVEMVIKMTGVLELDTPQALTKLPIHTMLTVPLNKGYFSISKSGEQALEEQITKSINLPIEMNMKPIIRGVILIGMGLCEIVMISIMTCELSNEERRKNQIKKIFNTYSSRLIAIDQLDIEAFEKVYTTLSMEDLVKVADELDRPVMFVEGSQNTSLLHKKIADQFYVMMNQSLYQYQVPNLIKNRRELQKKEIERHTRALEKILQKPTSIEEQSIETATAIEEVQENKNDNYPEEWRKFFE